MESTSHADSSDPPAGEAAAAAVTAAAATATATAAATEAATMATAAEAATMAAVAAAAGVEADAASEAPIAAAAAAVDGSTTTAVSGAAAAGEAATEGGSGGGDTSAAVAGTAAAAAAEEEDPLASVFDLLVCGTGLPECIAAAAAARAGQRVLHIDALDFYGGTSASFPLHQFPAVVAAMQFEGAPAADAAPAAAPAAPDAGGDLPAPNVLLTAGLRFHGAAPFPAAYPPSVLRKFTVDLLPHLTLARGAMIDALVRSNVANYLEFVVLHAAAMVEPPAPATHGAPAPSAWVLRKLPTTKADIFGNDYLSLTDKRKLMKFLQWALDLHTVDTDGTPVGRLNEHALGRGRSLLRPQNKSTAAWDLEAWRGRPFDDFLAHCELSPLLRALMEHAVALLPAPQGGAGGGGDGTGAADADSGMRRLRAYLAALGRFGNTAFIMPRYGHGEFSQAFTRACAVHGGIYMLREPPTAYHLPAGDAAPLAVTTADGRLLRARRILSGPAYLPAGTCEGVARASVGAAAVITTAPMPLDRLAFVGGAGDAAGGAGAVGGAPHAAALDASLAAIVIPPHCAPLANPYAVYLLQQSGSNMMAPGDACVVSVWARGADVPAGAPAAAAAAAREAAVDTVRAVVALLYGPCDPAAPGAGAGVWAQYYSLLTPLDAVPSPHPAWHVVRPQPPGGVRFTNEHDALEALEAFLAVVPGGEFFSAGAGEGAEEDDAAGGLEEGDGDAAAAPPPAAAPPAAAVDGAAAQPDAAAAPAPPPPPAAGDKQDDDDFDVSGALALLKGDA